MLVLLLASAVVFDLARRGLVGGAEARWRQLGLLALGLGVLVVVAQGLEYATITFRTADGRLGLRCSGAGRSSSSLFWLGALYWMETLVAQSLAPAAGRRPAGHRRQRAAAALRRLGASCFCTRWRSSS